MLKYNKLGLKTGKRYSLDNVGRDYDNGDGVDKNVHDDDADDDD